MRILKVKDWKDQKDYDRDLKYFQDSLFRALSVPKKWEEWKGPVEHSSRQIGFAGELAFNISRHYMNFTISPDNAL